MLLNIIAPDILLANNFNYQFYKQSGWQVIFAVGVVIGLLFAPKKFQAWVFGVLLALVMLYLVVKFLQIWQAL